MLRKNCIIPVRITSEEKDALIRRAQEAGLSLSEYLRYRASAAVIAQEERLARIERALCMHNEDTSLNKHKRFVRARGGPLWNRK